MKRKFVSRFGCILYKWMENSIIDHSWKRVYYSHVTQRDRLEIDTFLPNWQRQVRDLYAYWTPSPMVPIVHECASFARGGTMVNGSSWGWGGWISITGRRGSKRDLKISMQIRQIIIPTVRLAPGSYGELPWFRATARYVVYIAFSVTMYDWVTSYGSVKADLNRRNPKDRGVSLQRALGDI